DEPGQKGNDVDDSQQTSQDLMSGENTGVLDMVEAPEGPVEGGAGSVAASDDVPRSEDDDGSQGTVRPADHGDTFVMEGGDREEEPGDSRLEEPKGATESSGSARAIVLPGKEVSTTVLGEKVFESRETAMSVSPREVAAATALVTAGCSVTALRWRMARKRAESSEPDKKSSEPMRKEHGAHGSHSPTAKRLVRRLQRILESQ
ncbi:MAG: hypothetical protein R3B96_23870, partial [Pirellulaceae bacterium]